MTYSYVKSDWHFHPLKIFLYLVFLLYFQPVSLAKSDTDHKFFTLDQFLPKLSLDYSAETVTPAQIVGIQDRLLAIAAEYAELSFVPYIWGGERLGDKEDCLACRACVKLKGPPLEGRLQACGACRRCGIDCSHFVHRVYRDAGLNYDYASSHELRSVSSQVLLNSYQMVDIGKDLTFAEPGDILVYQNHVVMLTRVISPSHGDFVHITRFDQSRLHLGGMRWEKNYNLQRYRGKLLRILRHRRFFVRPQVFTFHQWDKHTPFAQILHFG